MEPIRRTNRADVVCDLILAALKRQDATLNGLANEALVLIGRGAVHALVMEVLTSKNLGYRLRLLRAIEEIGAVPDPADHMELFKLSCRKNSKIQEAATKVILAVGPHSSRRQSKTSDAAEASPASVTRP